MYTYIYTYNLYIYIYIKIVYIPTSWWQFLSCDLHGPRQWALHAAPGTTTAESLWTGRGLHCWHAAVQHVPCSENQGSWKVGVREAGMIYGIIGII